MGPTFITLEGPDGSGKSTQAALLAEKLTEMGLSVLLTGARGTGGAETAEILLNRCSVIGDDRSPAHGS